MINRTTYSQILNLDKKTITNWLPNSTPGSKLSYERRTLSIVLLLVLILLFSATAFARSYETSWQSMGGKIVGGIPFFIGNFRFEEMGWEAGLGLGGLDLPQNESRKLYPYYLLGGKYYFPSPSFFQPYIGVGFIGSTVGSSVGSLSADYLLKGLFQLGTHYPLTIYEIPLIAEAGLNWLHPFSHSDYFQEYGPMSWHLGFLLTF